MLTSIAIGVVDDNPAVLVHLRLVLERAGFTDVRTHSDPQRALAEFGASPPGVLLLDYLMPGLDGVALLEQLRRKTGGCGAVAMMTGFADLPKVREAAAAVGIVDVLPKTLGLHELAKRVRRLVDMVPAMRQPAMAFVPLLVPRFKPGESGSAPTSASFALLARMAALRDERTGKHTRRVGHYAAAIGHEVALTDRQQEQLIEAAQLHDLGNVGVPDTVLNKAGPLSAEERRQMECHTTLGHELLRDEDSPVLQLAAEIALSHHERWDGCGYPQGLRGDEIPLSARLVALADAFDAMTTIRPYRTPWLVERAVAVIESDSGSHFDPTLVEAFKRAFDHILRIKRHFDGEEPFAESAALMH